ncbi:MAG: zinc metallopeptidase [Lachnospiraceae bacterium]|nr:zinc metallopeptidase [Lachnospiraceae bacterium]
MYPRFYFDPTYMLVLIGVVICMLASVKVKSTYAKYASVRSMSGTTGKDAAERILRGAGIYDVRVEHISGQLSDHYDPRSKVLRLSDSTYASASVAAIGVAAHECGHAIQHATGYAPLRFRGALVPAANLGATIAWPLIIFGLLINGSSSLLLINIGIIAFSMAVLFHLVTLPVELNASGRAIKILRGSGLLREEEVGAVKKVLSAAALTYVAGAASSILQLLRILIITGGRRRND